MTARLVCAVVSLPLFLSLGGCGQVNGSNSTRVAQLRVIDTSPDAGSVDIYLDSTAAAYNLGFGSVSSYFPVAPATYTFTANTSGTRTVLTSVRGTLSANTQSTLLIGNVAAGLQSTLLTDQSQAAPAGQVLLRFINQATRTGSVDVYLVPSGGTLPTSAPVLQGITFGQVRPYLSVPAGNYSIYVLPNGTVPVSTTVPLYSGSQLSLPGSSARTLLLLDAQLTVAPVQVAVANDYDSPSATN